MAIPNADGLDLSHWNVVVDESAIYPYKLMSAKCTEGKSFVSPKFGYFWALFARMGARYRGAYHWVRSDSTMKSQVDHMASVLDLFGGLRQGDFIQLDWETTAGIPNMTVDQIEEWVGLATEQWGHRIIVYGSDWVPNFLAWRQANPTVPIWYANYNTSSTSTAGGWAECEKYNAAVWQWSSTYKAPGFRWNPDSATDGVDINHVFDWNVLDQLTHQTTVEPQEEDDVLRKVLIPAFAGNPGWWPWLACFDSGTVRPLCGGDVPPVDGMADVTDISQYKRLCHWAGVQLEVEQPVRGEDDSSITVNMPTPPPAKVTVSIPPLTFSGKLAP